MSIWFVVSILAIVQTLLCIVLLGRGIRMAKMHEDINSLRIYNAELKLKLNCEKLLAIDYLEE